MSTRVDPARLAGLLERWTCERDARERERSLFEELERFGAALGLFHATEEAWTRVRWRGPTGFLPTCAEVAAVAAGDLGPELPPDRLVLVFGRPAARRAVGLGACHASEEEVDYLEALLAAYELFGAEVEGGPAAPLPTEHAPEPLAPRVGAGSWTLRVVGERRAAHRRVTFETAIAPEVACASLALTGHAFARVLDHLLANAAEALATATFGPPRVRVALEPEAQGGRDGVRVRVQDSGPGVPRSLRGRLGEAGFCAFRPAGSRRGAGLARVRALARSVGGDLGFDESPWGGASFQVWIPLAAPAS